MDTNRKANKRSSHCKIQYLKQYFLLGILMEKLNFKKHKNSKSLL